MKQYRITCKNSRLGWRYSVQYKFWGIIWVDFFMQATNRFCLEDAQKRKIREEKAEKEFLERKKFGNSVVQSLHD